MTPEQAVEKAVVAEDITYSVGERVLFSGVGLSCQRGQMTALVGPSGCGKTTLLGILGLLVKPTAGAVLIDGQSTAAWGGGRRLAFWREEAAFIYQDYGLIDEEDVAYNVSLLRRLSRRRHGGAGWKRLDEVLGLVGLSDRDRDKAAVLSGGEKQRVGIARAIWKNASIIFADEPTASLDDANRETVMQLFEGLAKRGACVIFATHDDDLMARCAQVIDVSAFAPAAFIQGTC